MTPTTHALLSPSKAVRWCHCTPSARMEELMPEEQASEAAIEGTTAHALAELVASDRIADADLTAYDLEMVDGAYLYKEAITANPCDTIYTERKLDLGGLIPEGYGTCDAIATHLRADGYTDLYIYDYKYGKGVEVQAEDNYQLAIYASGALHDAEIITDSTKICNVIMTIVQPRIEGEKVKEWAVTYDYLMDWLSLHVQEQAKEAYEGTGSAVRGDWCRWCRAKAICRVQADAVPPLPDLRRPADTLTEEEQASYLLYADDAIKWLKALQDYATERAVSEGKQWPGMMLAEGRSVRAWTDEEQALKSILDRTDLTEEQVYTRTPLTLSKLEKLLGKKAFAEAAGEYVIKPQGAPKLVPSDTKGATPYVRLDAFDD